MAKQFVATRSVLLNGRMYQAGELIECVLTRGRTKLLMATKTIEEQVAPDAVASEPAPAGERNSVRPAKQSVKRAKA